MADPLQTFLEWLKEEALPGVWSRGVQLSRAAKSIQRISSPQSANEQKFKVLTAERMLAYELTLWLEDQDAYCSCDAKIEPCHHVVGAALALQNGLITDASASIDSTQPRLHYEWVDDATEGLALKRSIRLGEADTPLTGTLINYVSGIQTGRIKGPAISASPSDLKIDGLLSSRLINWTAVLTALSEMGEIRYGTRKLQASGKAQVPAAILRWKTSGDKTLLWETLPEETPADYKKFKNGLEIRSSTVVYRSPELRALKWNGRVEIAQDQLENFLAVTLPDLKGEYSVEVQAKLPELIEGVPELKFNYQALGTEHLTITATIFYPQAKDAIVRRDSALEQSLHHKLRHDYGMIAGQPLKLKPEDLLEVRKRFNNPIVDRFFVDAIAAQVNLRPDEIDIHRLTDFALVDLLLSANDATEKKLISQKLRPMLVRSDVPLTEIKAPEKIPRSIWNKLRPYQKSGVVWLHERKTLGTGAILADDMGLGKTIQTLAILEKRALVIVPTSLLFNWQGELKAHRPDLKVCVYHGAARKWDIYADVILSTYGTVRSEMARFYEPWTTLVLDEAHMIRNKNTIASEIILDIPVQFPIALTGTPVQNRAEDLETLLSFISPRKTVNRRMLPAYLLRRTKGEVLQDLPEKTRIEHHLELSNEEKSLYAQTFAAARKDILAKLARNEANFLTMFESLLRAREVCDHVGLVDRERWNEGSTKLDRLLDLVTELREAGHSVLVFSQWTRFLDRIEMELKPLDINYVRLDGSTIRRDQVIQKFNESPEPTVFLLSLHAGGVGLNLTKADHVIFCEPWWNPFVEFQAEDRVHRIGQKNAVTIHRLLCVGTVEEKIRELQAKKTKLGEAILTNEDEEIAPPALKLEDIELLISDL
ncbi:MAG: DEAD/DEAH box helicase [Bdellovibrionales bacterium]|nr:DEAD/DEAH box helicase [Bdellovibrionales bacterium]